MADSSETIEVNRGTNRRGLMRNVGLGLAGTALAAAGTAGLGLGTTPARADATLDGEILNFALNLEYLEAEFYLRAVTGSGIPSNLTGGTATVTGGSLVPFQNTAIAYLAQKIAVDELAHVTFLRTALGSAAVAEPNIDLSDSFTTLAIAAGLIVAGQTFDPFSSETNFLIGAYIFEDVGVTAYAGAAASLTAATLPYAASILAVEAYHAGAIRGRLGEIGGSAATNMISALRQTLSGVGDNGLNYQSNMFNFTNVDSNGQAYRRTPQQVLSIVYGGGTNNGLFYPNGMNGAVTTTTS
ncbi:ferritin-like domain-containing protein [Acidisoma cellulosilytica]|uniref:Ferritin-like domain-containing protein n=1 Tax=Acidisoma cellulosilyticum TaxID=2802395 RepID=A0A963Z5B1_9PROT|nr:ferritin-like domain-containing protein [Acidisoma cellulosilyticum]MCB8883165.1 ferritin-like domain-containing protein [Acidisoma cellulosilyticum]